MPRTKEQFEAMRIATRNNIHTAAIKLFIKKGFAATSIQDIASSAEISVGLMYRHYKNKEDLFNELVLFATEGLAHSIKRFQSNVAPVELIREFTQEILNDLEKGDGSTEFISLMNQAAAIEDPSTQIKSLLKQSEALLNQTTLLIENGQKINQFKQGNASEMALYFFSSIQGLTLAKLTMKERYITPSLEIVTAFLIEEKSISRQA